LGSYLPQGCLSIYLVTRRKPPFLRARSLLPPLAYRRSTRRLLLPPLAYWCLTRRPSCTVLHALSLSPYLMAIRSFFPDITVLTPKDDVSLVGPYYDIQEALHWSQRVFSSLGGRLQPDKCVLLGHKIDSPRLVNHTFPAVEVTRQSVMLHVVPVGMRGLYHPSLPPAAKHTRQARQRDSETPRRRVADEAGPLSLLCRSAAGLSSPVPCSSFWRASCHGGAPEGRARHTSCEAPTFEEDSATSRVGPSSTRGNTAETYCRSAIVVS